MNTLEEILICLILFLNQLNFLHFFLLIIQHFIHLINFIRFYQNLLVNPLKIIVLSEYLLIV